MGQAAADGAGRAAYTAIAARFGDPTAPPRPPHLITAEVCALSGKVPGPLCHHHKVELFIAGRVPTAPCDWHQLVCGQPTIVYPPALRTWTRIYRPQDPPRCAVATGADGPLAIVVPVDGARFALDPHRPPTAQRPPLAARPADAEVEWTIDGQPAERWVPVAGPHEIVARRGAETARVRITYD